MSDVSVVAQVAQQAGQAMITWAQTNPEMVTDICGKVYDAGLWILVTYGGVTKKDWIVRIAALGGGIVRKFIVEGVAGWINKPKKKG